MADTIPADGAASEAAPPNPTSGVVALGCILFLGVWVALLRDKWPQLPLGRALLAVCGAAAFVSLGVLSPKAAYAAVNLETLALLLGCMLISAILEKQGAHRAIARALGSKAASGRALLVRVMLVAGVASALLTNDAICIVLTPIVLRECARRRLVPTPFLIALAGAANAGSSLSPIGNPQNMIIALESALPFHAFLLAIGLSAAAALIALNAALLWVYREEVDGAVRWDASPAQLRAVGLGGDDAAPGQSAASTSAPSEQPFVGALSPAPLALSDAASSVDTVPIPVAAVAGGSATPLDAAAAHPPAPAAPAAPAAPSDGAAVATGDAPSAPSFSARHLASRLVLAALLPALMVSHLWIGLPWVAVTFAAALLVLDGSPGDGFLPKVDGTLLLFFSGLFVCVEGFNSTQVPAAAWAAVRDGALPASTGGVLAFTVIVSVGSNTVSNVPLVLLMAPQLRALAPRLSALSWLLLAWVSTLAGNLTLLGSVANLIVAEGAKAVSPLTFSAYTRVGFPATLLGLLVGTPLVVLCAQPLLPAGDG